MSNPKLSFGWNDTNLVIWVEEGSPYAITNALFPVIQRHLVDRQFRLRTDPSVRHLQSLHQTHFVGRRRDLHFLLHCHGRSITVEFWQKLVRPAKHPNPNGARYEFDKLNLMPPLIRRFFQVEQAHLTRLLVAAGYTNTTHPTLRTHSALEMVRHAICTCGHWRQGSSPDPLGNWHPRGAYNRNTDRDGRELAPGQVKYFHDDYGHLQRGHIYQWLNGQWFMVTGEKTWLCVFEPGRLFDFVARRDPRRHHPCGLLRKQQALVRLMQSQQARKAVSLMAAFVRDNQPFPSIKTA